jgi:hypothetical protein
MVQIKYFQLSVLFALLWPTSILSAQAVLFDFDNAPLSSPLPIDQTAGGITAHLSATGQGYSIQNANVHGFTPAGFGGRMIDPSSNNISDLQIRFDQTITFFSIMYSPQELGCDNSETMRVTAFMKGTMVGTNTRQVTFPGTWPTDTLSCSFAHGFDSVVVHYDSRPPTCQDYGTIFLADNMVVIPAAPTAVASNQHIYSEGSINPNPVRNSASVSFSLLYPGPVRIKIYDIRGRLVKDVFNGRLKSGANHISWNLNKGFNSGMYFLKIIGPIYNRTYRFIVVN